MPAKVDVVIAYYRQAQHWPKVLWGLRRNAHFIKHVYMVNDERWSDEDLKLITEPDGVFVNDLSITFLDHEHAGFGVCKSYNQGIAASDTEFVMVSSADVVFPPRLLAQKLLFARPNVIVAGPCTHVEEDSEPSAPKIIREDRFAQLRFNPDSRPWQYVRGVNRLIHRQAHLDIGGFDERFNEFNYEDYDHTARWVAKYGMSSVMYCDVPVYHLGDPKHAPHESSRSGELLKKSIQLAEARRLLDMGEVVVDFDDYCDATVHTLDLLADIKRAHPKFKVTLFAIPARCSSTTIEMAKHVDAKYGGNWLQLAPHGWRHTRGECYYWTSEEAIDKITRAANRGIDAPLFKAPAWLINDETVAACKSINYIVYNPGHLGIENYVHGHLSDTTGNFIYDMLAQGQLTFAPDCEFLWPQEIVNANI